MLFIWFYYYSWASLKFSWHLKRMEITESSAEVQTGAFCDVSVHENTGFNSYIWCAKQWLIQLMWFLKLQQDWMCKKT